MSRTEQNRAQLKMGTQFGERAQHQQIPVPVMNNFFPLQSPCMLMRNIDGVQTGQQGRIDIGAWRIADHPCSRRVKLKLIGGRVASVSPDSDDCCALAESAGLPIEAVLSRVAAAARRHFGLHD